MKLAVMLILASEALLCEKNPLTKCYPPERIVFYLESEVMRGLGSIPTGGKILSLDFFDIVKPLMPILALLPMLCVCENPDCLQSPGNVVWSQMCF